MNSDDVKGRALLQGAAGAAAAGGGAGAAGVALQLKEIDAYTHRPRKTHLNLYFVML